MIDSCVAILYKEKEDCPLDQNRTNPPDFGARYLTTEDEIMEVVGLDGPVSIGIRVSEELRVRPSSFAYDYKIFKSSHNRVSSKFDLKGEGNF